MAVEFALRPRIRIREGFAEPRRSRWRLPKLALPVLAYWLTAGGITYALIHLHAQPSVPESRLALAPAAASGPAWWELAPARPPVKANDEPTALPSPAPEPEGPIHSPVTALSTEADAPAAADDPELAGSAPSARELFDRPREKSTKIAEIAGESREAPAVGEPDTRASARAEVRAPDLLSFPPLPAEPPRETAPLLGATPPDAPAAVASALPTCEAAAAAATREIDLTHRETAPDLSRSAIASVLDNGVWIARCDIPMSTSIDLCIAIKGGAVIGASVTSRPASAAINACVKRRAASLHFPFSARVDLAKTHF